MGVSCVKWLIVAMVDNPTMMVKLMQLATSRLITR
jgi:hypothetical protein